MAKQPNELNLLLSNLVPHYASSSIGLGFFNPTSQPKRADVTPFVCSKETVTIGNGISEGEWV